MPQTHGLGKGIRALIPQESLQLKPEEVTRVPLKAIRPGRFQPRQSLDELKIQELANSIGKSGLIYPLLVRKLNRSGLYGPEYELIAGERRLRALLNLGETQAPVVVKEVGDKEALELSLIENVQREGLNPIEEATAYQKLAQEFHLTQEEIASRVGKDRVTIANTVRLLKLPEAARRLLSQGAISLGHGRALLGLGSEADQKLLGERIHREGLSVRQTEEWVKRLMGGKPHLRPHRAMDPHVEAAQSKLQRALGTKVEIVHRKSRGWIRIAYYSLKDLERLLGLLS